MWSYQRLPVARTVAVIAASIILGLSFSAGRSVAAEDQRSLQLEVVINHAPARMIGSFVRYPDGRIAATAEELQSVDIDPGRGRAPTDIVFLDEIPTLHYGYDERTQRILIEVGDVGRKAQRFDLAAGGETHPPRAQAGWGAVVNYDLLSTTNSLQQLRAVYFAGTSLSLNARAFSPFGTLEQSAIARTGPQQPSDLIRLNTSFRHSDQDCLITYTAGDLINGGLAWSRPIRIGGAQAQSNFGLRPDLITMPLPTLGGSAAVPSTVDVYVNNIKTFSQEVGAGPFSINNVPLISGAGNAELVIRDSAGHETKSSLPFYASANLLAPGLMSWSAEAGLPRLSYGGTSDAYVETPVASATLRRGIYDGLTVEAHAEGGAGIANGGAGAVVRTGTFGLAAVAVSASKSSASSGLQGYASYETRLFGVNISASSQRTFGTYDDLASATARFQNIVVNGSPVLNGQFSAFPLLAVPATISNGSASIFASARAPIALDRITLSRQLPFDARASISTSFIHLRDASRNLSKVLTASYSRSMPYDASLFATVFRDFGTNRNTGIFAGLSVPLGTLTSVSTGVSRGQGGTVATVDAVRSLRLEPGSYGWRLRDTEGATKYKEASASYRSTYGTVQAGVSQSGASTAGALELRGSITTMNGGVFLSNWIDDSFAVVSAGAPKVRVLYENRPVGVTDSKGMLLIPSLRSFQKNKITVDPTDLPVDTEVDNTREIVSPADRAGVLVKFDVHRDSTSALVTFVTTDGSVVPVGAVGHVAGGSEFVVGYDGQAFIRNLSAANEVDIEFNGEHCHAGFAFQPRPGEQVQIQAVACQ